MRGSARAENRFGELLQEARKDASLTQEQLAERMNRPKSWVVDIERGRTLPTDAGVIQALAYHARADALTLWSCMLEQSSKIPRAMVEARLGWESLGEMIMVGASAEPEIVRGRPMSYHKVEAAAEALAEKLFPLEVQQGAAMPIADILSAPDEFAAAAGLSAPLVAQTHEYNSPGDETIEGKTHFGSGCFFLSLRDDVWMRAEWGEGRSRFTLAHELGHLALHHELLQSQKVMAFRDEVASASQKLAPGVKIYESPEWQASAWAGAFLMPCEAVRVFIQSLEQMGLEFTIEDLAERFQVSVHAARIRLEKILPRLTFVRGVDDY